MKNEMFDITFYQTQGAITFEWLELVDFIENESNSTTIYSNKDVSASKLRTNGVNNRRSDSVQDKKQGYQNPKMEIVCLWPNAVIQTSGGNLTWNDGWNGNEWDDSDNTYIEE